jgi:hypothetical protein
LFVVWFVVQSVVGTAVAAYVVEGIWQHSMFRCALGDVSVDCTVTAGILGPMLMLMLALLLLESLIELRPWARIVTLIAG